jgi:hypothetical protein
MPPRRRPGCLEEGWRTDPLRSEGAGRYSANTGEGRRPPASRRHPGERRPWGSAVEVAHGRPSRQRREASQHAAHDGRRAFCDPAFFEPAASVIEVAGTNPATRETARNPIGHDERNVIGRTQEQEVEVIIWPAQAGWRSPPTSNRRGRPREICAYGPDRLRRIVVGINEPWGGFSSIRGDANDDAT